MECGRKETIQRPYVQFKVPLVTAIVLATTHVSACLPYPQLCGCVVVWICVCVCVWVGEWVGVTCVGVSVGVGVWIYVLCYFLCRQGSNLFSRTLAGAGVLAA